MADHSSLGSMLQGVSQQPAHIRTDGQVTEQINMASDVVQGLTSRPPVQLVRYNPDLPAGLTFLDVLVDGEDYQIGYAPGILRVLDSTGQEMTLVSDNNALAYAGANMTAYSYDDDIYLLNRDRVVAMAPVDPADEALVQKDVGLLSCLGGLFSHTYKVVLEYTDGTTAEGTYTTPDGLTDGDAALTASNHIVAELATSLAASPTLKEGTVVTHTASVLMITGAPDLKITYEDGSGGDTLRAQTNVTKSTQDLAEFAPHGTLVKVIGLDGTEDDFYMRFEVDGDPEVGTSFGSEGLWREWYDPAEQSRFDANTMPHVIEKTGDTEFTLRQTEWQGRRTGDSLSNVEPSFVGRAIRDINGFQSRLAFISGPHAIMSRTNIPTDFFKQSVVAETASDPIDIISTSEDEFTLNWIIPFDRDLVLYGDNVQFLISGVAAITPSNASMVETTKFKIEEGAKPVSTGRTILFPFQSGSYAGVKEFFSINTEDANTAVDITKVQNRYMQGRIVDMQSSTDYSMVLCRTDLNANTLFIHQYYWDGDSKAQAAWYKWVFHYNIVNAFFTGSQINILMYDDTLGYIQTYIDLDNPSHPMVDYSPTLDLLTTETVVDAGDYSSVILPYPDAAIAQGTGCSVVGDRISKVSFEDIGKGYRYTFSKNTAPPGASVIVGRPYLQMVKPTMPFIRDRNGKVQKLSRLVVTNFIVHYEDSGFISSRMSSKYRSQDTVLSNEYVLLDRNPDDPDQQGIRSGLWDIPWGERSDWSELELFAADVRPFTIIDLEWIGQPLTRGRRV